MPATNPTNNVSQPPAVDTSDPQAVLAEQQAEYRKEEAMSLETNLAKSQHDMIQDITRNIGS